MIFATSNSGSTSRFPISCRFLSPSITDSTSHSRGKRSMNDSGPSSSGASRGVTRASGILSAIRDHSSMRRGPSLSSDPVLTRKGGFLRGGGGGGPGKEKKTFRHHNRTDNTHFIFL